MSHLISERAKSRSEEHFTHLNLKNAPKSFVPHPDPIALDYGTPNAGFFPVTRIRADVANHPFQDLLPVTAETIQPEGCCSCKVRREQLDHDSTLQSTQNEHFANTILIERDMSEPNLIDLSRGLQYSDVNGIPQMLKFTRELIERVHPPAYDEWTTIMSTGASDGLNRAADVFVNPGDTVLLEEFTFTPFVQNILNAGGKPIPIKMKLIPGSNADNGIDLTYLTDMLENWDEYHPELKGKTPKALYTISTGQNPTGLTQSLDLRKKIYALAEKHDFVIIEDDPYGYLTLPPFAESSDNLILKKNVTVEEYLAKHLAPSYLTIDTSGRVLRIESFSKIFAPGLRLGFVVGHKNVLKSISNYANVAIRSSSGVAQILVNNVIQQSFGGVDGWLQWILKMRETYTIRRDVLLQALLKLESYKAGYFDVIDPQAGMFISVFINFPQETNTVEQMELLQWKFRAYGVSVVSGFKMAVDLRFSEERGNFFRLTYASANNADELIEGGARFGKAVYAFFQEDLELN